MKRLFVLLVVVFVLSSTSLAAFQSNGSFVGSRQQQDMSGSGMHAQATLAGGINSQQQSGFAWSQKQLGGSAVGQVNFQCGKSGDRYQGQEATAETLSKQNIEICGPTTQGQDMTLNASQGQNQWGKGAQVQAQADLSGQAQRQKVSGPFGANQTQKQFGGIVQVEGQFSGCTGVQMQAQEATVQNSQTQIK